MTDSLADRLRAFAEFLSCSDDRYCEYEALVRDAIAALTPPSGEVGGLIERLEEVAQERSVDFFGLAVENTVEHKAAAHLRALAAENAELAKRQIMDDAGWAYTKALETERRALQQHLESLQNRFEQVTAENETLQQRIDGLERMLHLRNEALGALCPRYTEADWNVLREADELIAELRELSAAEPDHE